jgi:peptidoglycan/xylan/chitin deacetylase (PgdA/CDA1 family)
MASALSKERVQFLYLHHVVKDEADSFRLLLRALLNTGHRFIAYSEAVERVLKGNIDGGPHVSFSFDDGLKSCLRAARIMSEFGAKGCFFVCPSMIGETDPQKVEEFCFKRLNKPPMEFLSWEDVGTLLEEGHEIGAHTMTHLNLAEIPIDQMQEQIGGSFDALAERVGKPKHFSWPFGRFSHFGAVPAKTVFGAGFESCASAERGCHVARSEKQKIELCIRRDHVVADWPLNHTLYFMARNSLRASAHNDKWPPEWSKVIQRGA